MIVLSHRGLDLERTIPLPENSLAAFEWSFKRGFGVELDLQMTGEGELLIAHDSLTAAHGKELGSDFSHLCTLAEALVLAKQFPKVQLAVHLKGQNQNDAVLSAVAKVLAGHADLHPRILIFDLTLAPARSLRKAFPDIGLAPSVAHVFDVQRFQSVAHGTLFPVHEILYDQGPFDWVWLDEWDRSAVDGKTKALYEPTIPQFQAHGLKVAVISPELHRAEKHPDAESIESLEARWREVLKAKPQAICTDYPARLSGIFAAG